MDIMPDHLDVENNETGERIQVPCMQVWCDPDRPAAYQDPELFAYLDSLHCAAVVVRYSETKALVIVRTKEGWSEQPSASMGERESPNKEIINELKLLWEQEERRHLKEGRQ